MTREHGYLTQRELQDRWRLSRRTLERWRADGCGPACYMLGRSVRYRLVDIEAFEARHRREGAPGQGRTGFTGGKP